MAEEHEDMGEVKLDQFLINEAQAVFERQPKSASEVIERWAYLGQAAEAQLTERERLLLMAGSGVIQLSVEEQT